MWSIHKFVTFIAVAALATSCSFFTGTGKMSHKDGAQVSAARALIAEVTNSMQLQLEGDGVAHAKALSITTAARSYANSQASKLVVGLRLSGFDQVRVWIGLRVNSTSLLTAVMPTIVEGAIAAVDNAGVNAAADKALVSGKIMKSSLVAIKDYFVEMDQTTLVTLNSSMTRAGVAALAETGLTASELGAAINDITEYAVGALLEADIPTEALAAVAGSIAEGAVMGLSSLDADAATLLDDVIAGAVSGIGDAGLSDALGTSALQSITQFSIEALDDAGITSIAAIESAIGVISESAIASIDEAGLSDALEAVSAIASGIGIASANLADADVISTSQLDDLAAAASTSLSEDAATLGLDEGDLAAAIAGDLLEGISQGGGDIDAVKDSVSGAIIAEFGQDVAADVSAAVTEAEQYDTAMNNQSDMPLCSSFDSMSTATLLEQAFTPAISGQLIFCRYGQGQSCPSARDLDATNHLFWDGNFDSSICLAYGVQDSPSTDTSTDTSIGVPSWPRLRQWSTSPEIAWDPIDSTGTVEYKIFFQTTPGVDDASSTGWSTSTEYYVPYNAIDYSATMFCFRVAAVVNAVQGTLSEEVCETKYSSPYLAITTDSAALSAAITWTPIAGATTQTLFWTADANPYGLPLGVWNMVNLSSSATSHSITSMTKGTFYYVLLRTTYPVGGVTIQKFSSQSQTQIPLPYGYVDINAGSAYTATPSVTLSVSAYYSSDMMFCNNASFTGCSWVTFTYPYPWTLIAGDGLKTVYAKFKDASGTESAVISDTITIDTTPPTLTFGSFNPASPGIAITPKVIGTTSADTNYVGLYSDAICTTAVGGGTKTDFEGSGILLASALSPGSSITLYGKATDGAGNNSMCVSMGSYTHEGTTYWLDAQDSNADGTNSTGPVDGVSNWYNKANPAEYFTLSNFQNTTNDGWAGSGTVADPYRLEFPDANTPTRYVAVGSPTTSRTYLVWFNARSADINTRYIFAHWTGSVADTSCSIVAQSPYATSGITCAYGDDTNPVMLGDVTLDTWHHIAITSDGTTRTFYLDGIPVNTLSGGHETTTGQIYLGSNGASANCAYSCLDGSIADFRVYANTALTAAKVRAQYETGRVRFYNDPGVTTIERVVPAIAPVGGGSNVTIYGWNMSQGATIGGMSILTPSTPTTGTLTGSIQANSAGLKSITINGHTTANAFKYTSLPIGDMLHLDAENPIANGTPASSTLASHHWVSLSAEGTSRHAILSNHQVPAVSSDSGFLGDGTTTGPRRLQFNGSTDFVDAGKIGPAKSYVVWFSWDGMGGSSGKTILNKMGASSTRLSISSNQLDLTYNGSNSAIVGLEPDSWHMAAMVHDGTSANFFINGNLLATNTAPAESATGQLALGHLGGANQVSYWAFDGAIANVKVYSTTLTAAEIRAMYTEEKSRFPIQGLAGPLTAGSPGPGFVSLNLPSTTPGANFHISKVDIRASMGIIPADCASGSIVTTHSFPISYPMSVTHPGLNSADTWGYRLCVYDGANNLIDSTRTAMATVQ